MVPAATPAYRRGMNLHRKRHQEPAAETDEHTAHLHDLAPLHHDDDGRPTGEDRHTYDMLPDTYVQAVDRPSWLKPPQRRRKADTDE